MPVDPCRHASHATSWQTGEGDGQIPFGHPTSNSKVIKELTDYHSPKSARSTGCEAEQTGDADGKEEL